METTWKQAEKLYKSEAIDSFGNRYLLGVFENQEDAKKAFDAWNKEYEQALEGFFLKIFFRSMWTGNDNTTIES